MGKDWKQVWDAEYARKARGTSVANTVFYNNKRTAEFNKFPNRFISTIPDADISADNKERLVKALIKSRKHNLPPEMVFGNLLLVVRDKHAAAILNTYRAFKVHHSNYLRLRSLLMSAAPPYNLNRFGDSGIRNAKNMLHEAIRTFDAVFWFASDAYGLAKMCHRPKSRGTRKHFQRCFIAHFYEKFRLQSSLAHAAIVDLISTLLECITGADDMRDTVTQTLYRERHKKRSS